MSRRRNYSAQTIAVMERFFEALETCANYKLVKNVSRYCDDNGIDKRHFFAQRQDLGRGYFEISWAIPLLSCGVSALWLLTGKGTMFDASMVTVSLKAQPEAI